MISMLKRTISDLLQKRALEKYGSLFGWRGSAVFGKYNRYCQKVSPVEMSSNEYIKETVEEFLKSGVVMFQTDQTRQIGKRMMKELKSLEDSGNFWETRGDSSSKDFCPDPFSYYDSLQELFEGDLGELLRSINGSEFKLFYSVMLKSLCLSDAPYGSALWHNDGGPGTCINIMFLPHGVKKEQGALMMLPWDISKKLLWGAYKNYQHVSRLPENSKLDRYSLREIKRKYYDEQIENNYMSDIFHPTGEGGMAVLFLSNAIHRGGHPEKGYERIAVISHCYPSDQKPDIADYRKNGRRKITSLPSSPDFN